MLDCTQLTGPLFTGSGIPPNGTLPEGALPLMIGAGRSHTRLTRALYLCKPNTRLSFSAMWLLQYNESPTRTFASEIHAQFLEFSFLVEKLLYPCTLGSGCRLLSFFGNISECLTYCQRYIYQVTCEFTLQANMPYRRCWPACRVSHQNAPALLLKEGRRLTRRSHAMGKLSLTLLIVTSGLDLIGDLSPGWWSLPWVSPNPLN